MINLSDIINAFHMIALADNRINSFVFGSVRNLEDEQRSKIKYPVLMLYVPDTVASRDVKGVCYEDYSFEFDILDNPGEKYEDQTNSLVNTEKIIKDWVYWLKKGVKIDGLKCFLFEEKTKIGFGLRRPICQHTPDGLWGWGLSVQITSQYTCDPAATCNIELPCWKEVLVPVFSWDFDGNTLELVNESTGSQSFESTWYYKQGNSEWECVKIDSFSIQNLNGESVEIRLCISTDTCQAWAKAVTFDLCKKLCGKSYPSINENELC